LGGSAARDATADAFQPHMRPSFCCLSHACKGAKYSSIAAASMRSLPVICLRVCCQGWLAPVASIAWNFRPAALLP
jgi:hypothetical protein